MPKGDVLPYSGSTCSGTLAGMRELLALSEPAAGHTGLSASTALALLPLVLLLGAVVVYCLVDLVRSPTARYLPKPVWAVVIVFGSVPIGAILYLVLGRDSDARRSGAADAERDAVRP